MDKKLGGGPRDSRKDQTLVPHGLLDPFVRTLFAISKVSALAAYWPTIAPKNRRCRARRLCIESAHALKGKYLKN